VGNKVYAFLASIPLYFFIFRLLIPFLSLPFYIIPPRLVCNIFLLLYTPIWFFVLEFRLVDLSLYKYKVYKPKRLKGNRLNKDEHIFPALDTMITPTWFISNFMYNWSLILIAMWIYKNKPKPVNLDDSISETASSRTSFDYESGASTPTIERFYTHRKLSEHNGSLTAGLHVDRSLSYQRVPFREYGHTDENTLPPLAATLLPVMNRDRSPLRPFFRKQPSLSVVKPIMERHFGAGSNHITSTEQTSPQLETSHIQEKGSDDSDEDSEDKRQYASATKPLPPLLVEIPGLSINELSPEPSPLDIKGKLVSLDDKIRLFGGRSPSMRPRNSPGMQATIDFRHDSTDGYEEPFPDTRYMSRSIDLSHLSYSPVVGAAATKEQQQNGHLNPKEFWKSKGSIHSKNSIVLMKRAMTNFPITPIMMLESEGGANVQVNARHTLYPFDSKLRLHRASTFSSYGVSSDYTRNRLTSFFMSMPPEYPLAHDAETGLALYSYKEIVRRNYCKEFSGIDPKSLERYLTDEEFLNVFTMSKVCFLELQSACFSLILVVAAYRKNSDCYLFGVKLQSRKP
jgi:hypothetical protein